MKNKIYYEKRIIHDINDNIYLIWVIYNINKFDIKKQLCVFDNINDFNNFSKYNNIIFRKYTKNRLQ